MDEVASSKIRILGMNGLIFLKVYLMENQRWAIIRSRQEFSKAINIWRTMFFTELEINIV